MMTVECKNTKDLDFTYPFVSVVVPACNSPHRTATCIEALLKQSYPKDRYEIIVVDNGSTDNTPQVIKQYPVTFLVEDTIQSPYAARNMGIIHARGEVIAMIDVNCTPIYEWIEEGLKAMETEDADLVGGQVKFVFSTSKTVSEIYDSITNVQIERNIRERKVTKGGNLFVNRTVFNAIGLFPLYRSGGDVSWTGKATRAGFKLVYAPQALVTYPARKLLSLLRKQFRVGQGQPNIWLEEGIGYPRIFARTIRCFLPLMPSLIWKIIEERGTNDTKRRFNYQSGTRKTNKKVLSMWCVSYLCALSTGLGILRSIPVILRRRLRK